MTESERNQDLTEDHLDCTVSIVTPVRNEARNIAGTLERVNRTNPDEVIVVDGGSTDGTADIAESCGATVIMSAPGRGRQLHSGAMHSTSEVILFLHADASLPDDSVQAIRSVMSDPNVLCGCFEHTIDAEGWLYRRIERHDRRRVERTGIVYGDQGLFMRRATYDALGGFEAVPLMEDVRLMRAFRKQFRSRPIILAGPLTISARRWQGKGILRTSVTNWFLRQAERIGVSPDRLARWYGYRIQKRDASQIPTPKVQSED